MRKKLLDSSILDFQWQRMGGRSAEGFNVEDVRRWAEELKELHGGAAIVTPIYLEVVCGAKSEREMRLTVEYLAIFEIVDKGQILREDWTEAERLARRVPRDGKPRQLGDCLIRALANRLKMDVVSRDRRFPR